MLLILCIDGRKIVEIFECERERVDGICLPNKPSLCAVTFLFKILLQCFYQEPQNYHPRHCRCILCLPPPNRALSVSKPLFICPPVFSIYVSEFESSDIQLSATCSKIFLKYSVLNQLINQMINAVVTVFSS